MNTLYYGDNLEILRNEINDESVDLIYLDPPFNSKRDYAVLFKSPKGHESKAQITAFEDSWHWGEQAEHEFTELVQQSNTDVSETMQALRRFLGENDMMAYLTMMANRLLELHRVLRPTGSLYLHCDPTASHYLKVVLDNVFGKEMFLNEIIWQRTGVKGDAARKYGAVHDSLMFYAKGESYIFNSTFLEADADYLGRFRLDDNDGKGAYRLAPLDSPSPRPNLTYDYKGYKPPAKGWRVNRELMEQLDREGRLAFPKTKDGRIARKHYLSEQEGRKVSDVWTDIPPLQASAAERLGYPTQKPLALLERIIRTSSSPDSVILDPFCGCGTAIHAAQNLRRKWIGIDITHLAISLVEKRLRDAFPHVDFEVHGTPKDVDSARDLATRDKYEFQWWACSLVNAQPYKGKKKGSDTGIDGLIFFQDDQTKLSASKDLHKKIIVSVKAGENIGVAMIRDLGHVVEREKAAIGLFITLATPTGPMTTEAVKAGYYQSPTGASFPKIQILTIEGLMNGTEQAKYPDLMRGGLTFKRAKKEMTDEQMIFGLEQLEAQPPERAVKKKPNS